MAQTVEIPIDLFLANVIISEITIIIDNYNTYSKQHRKLKTAKQKSQSNQPKGKKLSYS